MESIEYFKMLEKRRESAAKAKAMPIQEFLAKEIKRSGWKNKEFYGLADIKHATFYNVLSGETKISRKIAAKLSRVLGRSEDFWMRSQVIVDEGANVIPFNTAPHVQAIASPGEGNAPQLLTDGMLRSALEQELIAITNYQERHQKAASYDLTLAPTARMLSPRHGEELDMAHEGELRFAHGDSIAIQTNEEIRLSPNYIARVGATAGLAHDGILLNTGLHIDPAYSGPLRASLVNMSGREHQLFPGQVIMRIEVFYIPVAPTDIRQNEVRDVDIFTELREEVQNALKRRPRPNGATRVWLPESDFEVLLEGEVLEVTEEALDVLAEKVAKGKEVRGVLDALVEIASDFTPRREALTGALEDPAFSRELSRRGIVPDAHALESFAEGQETLTAGLRQAGVPLEAFLAHALSRP